MVAYPTEASARSKLSELSQEEGRWWLDHAYASDGVLYEILDCGGMWNHSGDSPNCGLPPTGSPEYDWEGGYSTRDIHAGDELLCDYGLFDYPEWVTRLCKEYGVDRSFVQIKTAPDREAYVGASSLA